MKNTKQRFGISLDSELTEEVEKLAAATGTTRSSIVGIAVREFLSERFHFAKTHECEGVFVVRYEPSVGSPVERALEERKAIAVSRLHVHATDGHCVEILYVRASSKQIIELENSLMKCGCKMCKFVPCHS